MAEEKKQEKKIIIDEDWKGKAQKEKEVLKEKEKIGKEKEDGGRNSSINCLRVISAPLSACWRHKRCLLWA